MSKTLLVTGSSGLIGSEVCVYFARELGYTVHGVDNNQRAVFFGPSGDTRWNQNRLAADLPGFVHQQPAAARRLPWVTPGPQARVPGPARAVPSFAQGRRPAW